MRWFLLRSPPLDGPANMALDHALMARARRSGEAVLRVYEWSVPVLSLGRNQRARDVYIESELARRGITVVRRPTGGRALLHHREITYSVTAPLEGDGLGAAYGRVNDLLLAALDTLDVPAALAQPVSRSHPPTALPCFAEPARGEIVLGGRKLVGSAQWRDEGAMLQHGSLLVDDDQSTIPRLMREPGPAAPPPATLRDALGRAPSAQEFANALFSAVHRMVDPSAAEISGHEVALLADATLADHYGDPAWTWRR